MSKSPSQSHVPSFFYSLLFLSCVEKEPGGHSALCRLAFLILEIPVFLKTDMLSIILVASVRKSTPPFLVINSNTFNTTSISLFNFSMIYK